MGIAEEKLAFAMQFAATQHQRQTRKYSGEPYITHPFAVAGTVAGVRMHYDVIVAAFLHDVVEDCGITIRKIRGLFGPDVAQLVNEVTDISLPLDGNRKLRKMIDRDHLSTASPEGKTIKLADIIDNCKTLPAQDWEFAKVYMAEKKKALEVLKEGDKKLLNVATGIIADYYEWMEEVGDE